MPEYRISSADGLIEALKKTNKEKDVVISFLVNEIVFNKKGLTRLVLERDSYGVHIKGPVTLRGAQFRFELVKYPIILESVRVRVGAQLLGEGDADDALYALKCSKILINHCSFSDSSDEIVSLDRCGEVTILNSILSDPLHRPTVNNEGKKFIHPEGAEASSHGYGLRCNGTRNLKVVNSIIANCYRRSPQCSNEGIKPRKEYLYSVDNCIIFNYGKEGFVYNNKFIDEESTSKYKVQFKHNLFIPGPRTDKSKSSEYEALEFNCENPRDMKFSLDGIESNRVAFYTDMLVLYGGKKYYAPNGQGLTQDPMDLLSLVGCLPKDAQDSDLSTNILSVLKSGHKYDGLDPDKFHKEWYLSWWKSW